MKTYIKYKLNIGDYLRTIYKQKDIDKIQIGCTIYTYDDAIKAIRLKYGENSEYEEVINSLYNTDDDNWEEVTNDIDYSVLKLVANNPNTTTETLDILSKSKLSSIRSLVARNPNTTTEILSALSKDNYYEVRSSVARNPNTPPETLDALSKDNYYEVIYSLAYNPNTPAETLNKLSNDESYDVIHILSYNPNTPAETLDKIRKTKNINFD